MWCEVQSMVSGEHLYCAMHSNMDKLITGYPRYGWGIPSDWGNSTRNGRRQTQSKQAAQYPPEWVMRKRGRHGKRFALRIFVTSVCGVPPCAYVSDSHQSHEIFWTTYKMFLMTISRGNGQTSRMMSRKAETELNSTQEEIRLFLECENV